MPYADVSVNSPIAQRRTFSYSIPSGLNITAGHAVWVPFGTRTLQGMVLAVTAVPAVEETRDIIGIIEPRPVLSPEQVQLARWISDYYLSSLFDAVALMLPPGFERASVTFISITSRDFSEQGLTPEQETVVSLLQGREKVSLKEIEKALGKQKAQAVITQLSARNLIVRQYGLQEVRIRPRQIAVLRLAVEDGLAQEEAARLRQSPKLNKQASLLEFLSCATGPVALAELKKNGEFSTSAVMALVKKGLLIIEYVTVRRDPLRGANIESTSPLVLSTEQEAALLSIRESLRGTVASDKPQQSPQVFLLKGVTGSGKTEIYLQALAEAVRLGKRGIVLVPEISLTPQTIERFASRFPGKVAVMHSKLSPGEQFDEWHRIRDGEFDVVIGSRSAIFAPQPDLGLIVVDEEHEWTYKQHDKSPCYHTRAVGLKLAELTGATVVLGSATPSVESYYRAQAGVYRLLEMPRRITPVEGTGLPPVCIIDSRQELKSGNRSVFSRYLSQAMAETIARGEQIILFLNRRGGPSFIQCRRCGHVLRCRRCEIAFAYHPVEDRLLCHQCNHSMRPPSQCPECGSDRIKFLGAGTQTLEQEVRKVLPEARVLRWDSDVTRSKYSHQEILERFRAHEADILVGTQMVAKGLDLPNVTLVGAINADIGLNLPDFRAAERTFQLLSQVAGRAGRGTAEGQAIIQTYSPEHYSVQAASRHDYSFFFRREIAFRQELHDPPFTRLVRLVYSHTSNTACQRETERVKKYILEERDARGIVGLTIIGPAPAFAHKLRGRFRWQLVLRGPDFPEFIREMRFPAGWTIDVDPVGLS